MSNQGRGLIVQIFKNIWQSLQPRQFTGTKIGIDRFGNTYYEIPADRTLGKRKAERWFTPKDKDAFDQELAAEWESWLRFRRIEPPTEEELKKNLALMEMKKKNALKLEAEYASEKSSSTTLLDSKVSGFESFPRRDEYELSPGAGPRSK